MRIPLFVRALCLSVLLSGCGGGDIASVSGSSFSSGSGSTLAVAQFATHQTQSNDTENDSTVQFSTKTTAGDAIWVAVTVSDFAGTHSITISDTQGNTFTRLDQENDGYPGYQSVAQFYAPNIAGDSTTPDTITVNWTNDDYKGVLIAEISGVTTAPLVGHSANIQDGLSAGTDNVSSGGITVSSLNSSALLVAVSMDTSGGVSDDGLGSGSAGPTVGSNFSDEGVFWDWGANLATFETGTISSSETVTATFNARHSDNYVTVAAVFH